MNLLRVNRPFDGTLIKEIPLQNADDVENAITMAHALFQDRSTWLQPHQRIEILENVVQIMGQQIDLLARTAAEEGGKPYLDSKVEVLRAINGVKLSIEHMAQIKGEQIPMGQTAASTHRLAFTMREPIGVVLSISAFNHPLNLIIHQIMPAIAVGAPVIIKPAKTTPLSCLKLMEILRQAGLPKGWCQALVCERQETETLVSDTRINYLSFIGSAGVGWMLRSKLSPGTRCALEHGGAAPVIVEADADIEPMIDSLLKGGFYHAGQVCVSVQRVFIHESLCEAVAQRLAEKARGLIVGDPLDEKTEVGPLILPKEVDRIEQWVEQARQQGAKVLCGGKRISDSCYAPTVLLNPSQHSTVSQSEIFGPVVCLYAYTDRQQAIKLANALPFGFQASVFTKDINTAFDTISRLNASAVMVNDHTAFRVDWMPFGGRDSSGIGMGGIQYSMHEMTREKMFVINSPAL
ncbi:MAG: aldehyde dehydrogenase family protein [Gammaproteobacteria bacterium]|nr:aldehyde dehydrogenase family protein [Gammaproteobacteria bacterium]